MQDFNWRQFDCFELRSQKKYDANQWIPRAIGQQQQQQHINTVITSPLSVSTNQLTAGFIYASQKTETVYDEKDDSQSFVQVYVTIITTNPQLFKFFIMLDGC